MYVRMDGRAGGWTHTDRRTHNDSLTHIPERGHKQAGLFLVKEGVLGVLACTGVCQLARTLREVGISGTRAGISAIHKPSNTSLNEGPLNKAVCS